VVVFGDDDVGDVVADWLQARAYGEQGGQGVEALDDAEAVGGDVVAGVDGESRCSSSVRRSSARWPCRETNSWMDRRSSTGSDIVAPRLGGW